MYERALPPNAFGKQRSVSESVNAFAVAIATTNAVNASKQKNVRLELRIDAT